MTKAALAAYSNIRAPVARHLAASDTAPSGTRRWTTWVGAAVVGGLTLVVFLPALLNGSVNFDHLDDLPSNPHSQALFYFLALLLTEVAFLVARSRPHGKSRHRH